MRIVFMGSSDFSCPALDALLAWPRARVVGVVTQPDRRQGRGLERASCAAKAHVEGRGIPILTPARVGHPDSVREVAALEPDAIVVVAYGQLLPAALLAVPPLGCVNVHASLLPRYRGAAPAQWAIARGEAVTGVTTMRMNERMDEGDVLLQREVAILEEDTGGSLLVRLAACGARLLVETMECLAAGALVPVPQDHARATYAPKLTKQDGVLDWGQPAPELANRVRAFDPWPGCTCTLGGGGGEAVKVLRSRAEAGDGAPGRVLDVSAEGPLVAAAPGTALRLLTVQPAGRRPMSGGDFARGHRLAVAAGGRGTP